MTDFKALLDQLKPGPWHWRGQPDDVTLCTAHSGWIFLMGVARCGMGGAQFTFQSFVGDRADHGLQKCHHDGMYVPRAPYAPREIADINHPLAQLIKAIPEMVARINELEHELDSERRRADQLTDEVARNMSSACTPIKIHHQININGEKL